MYKVYSSRAKGQSKVIFLQYMYMYYTHVHIDVYLYLPRILQQESKMLQDALFIVINSCILNL